MPPPLPRRSVWTCHFAHVIQTYQSSPIGLPGRPAHCPFRGLLGVHSRCGLHTRAVTNLRHANRRLQPLRYLHDCSDCFRLERLPGGACTHWKAPPSHGAHVKWTFRLGAGTLMLGKRRVEPVRPARVRETYETSCLPFRLGESPGQPSPALSLATAIYRDRPPRA